MNSARWTPAQSLLKLTAAKHPSRSSEGRSTNGSVAHFLTLPCASASIAPLLDSPDEHPDASGPATKPAHLALNDTHFKFERWQRFPNQRGKLKSMQRVHLSASVRHCMANTNCCRSFPTAAVSKVLPPSFNRAKTRYCVATTFRNTITADGSSGFKAEAGRYHLYISHACPWVRCCG